jgi:hypothetical protein
LEASHAEERSPERVSKHEASPFETTPQRLLRLRRKDEI